MNRAALITIARGNFLPFLRVCFEILNPSDTFVPGWPIEAVIQVLLDLKSGRSRRWAINMPPRALKSTIVSAAWPAFLLGLDPATRILVTSYNQDFAERLSSDTRRIMELELYRQIFPRTNLIKRTNLNLETDRAGGRQATSIGGSITGFGAEWIIIDDPHNAFEAYSPTAREAVKRYYGQSLFSRLNNRATAKMVLVMQRLHADDLTGHVLAQGGWNLLKLPAEATEDLVIDVGHTNPHFFRKGELLLPELLPQAELDDLQQQMGSVAYQAQYQQDPVPDSGNMIKRDWLRYYDTPPSYDGAQVTMSLDTATKTDTAHDYSVCTIWLTRKNDHHLIYVWRDKVDFPDLRKKALELHKLFHADNLLIEDQGAGSSLIQELLRAGIPAIARKARDPKQVRLAGVSSYIESGQVLLPRDAPWLAEFESELLAFPGAKHDDQVDSLSQYLAWARDRPSTMFEYEFI